MAYNNVNKRIVNLANVGLLEEVKIGESIHGRKDYKVNMNGLELLIPEILTHPKEIENIVRYMDKFGLDKDIFESLLLEKYASVTKLVNEYEYLKQPFEGTEDTTLRTASDQEKHSSLGIFSYDKMNVFLKQLTDLTNAGLINYDLKTKTYIPTKEGSKYLTVAMIKPTQEFLIAAGKILVKNENIEKIIEDKEFEYEEKMQSEMFNTSRVKNKKSVSRLQK
jgi:hypothetical protein